MGIECASLWLHLPRQVNGIKSCWVVHGQMNKHKLITRAFSAMVPVAWHVQAEKTADTAGRVPSTKAGGGDGGIATNLLGDLFRECMTALGWRHDHT